MTELNKQKIFWHSRRGMLELDLLLVPFATEVFENLSTEDQLLYCDLLAEERSGFMELVFGEDGTL